jgi:hypothetical protein
MNIYKKKGQKAMRVKSYSVLCTYKRFKTKKLINFIKANLHIAKIKMVTKIWGGSSRIKSAKKIKCQGLKNVLIIKLKVFPELSQN